MLPVTDINIQPDCITIHQPAEVANGGTTDGLGYYGWVKGTQLDILMKNKGQAAGNPDLI
eukprot:734748-Ditylum_brightwellii.AAC.1